MLVRLLYASRSDQEISNTLIEEVLSAAQVHNPENGITGLLCYGNNVFVQALEGGREQVNRLFQLLAKDQRHHDVTILQYQEIEQRRFANWSMARVPLDKLNMSQLLRYSETATLDPFCLSGACTALLLEALADAGAKSR